MKAYSMRSKRRAVVAGCKRRKHAPQNEFEHDRYREPFDVRLKDTKKRRDQVESKSCARRRRSRKTQQTLRAGTDFGNSVVRLGLGVGRLLQRKLSVRPHVLAA